MRAGTATGALAGAMLLGMLLLCGALAPWIATAPDEQDLAHRLDPPSSTHPLGRDDLGRDVLSRLLWGARTSLPLAVLVVGLSALVGTLLGVGAGYAGGLADAALSSISDLLLAFPGLLLAIALVAAMGPRTSNLVVALCLVGWVTFARLARGETLRLKQREFVDAALALGAGRRRIMLRHLLPHLIPPLTVQAALGLGGVILAEAGLSFLGLGVPPPAASWGGMLHDGTQNLLDAPLLAFVPGVAISLTVLGAQLLGDGLRQVRTKRG